MNIFTEVSLCENVFSPSIFLTLVLKTLERDYLTDTRAKALEISSSLGHLSKFLMRQLAAKASFLRLVL